jgi:ankyrin repeat protein
MGTSDQVMSAITEGDLERLEGLIAEDRGAAAARNEAGVSALLTARYHGRQDMVDAILRAGPELDVFDAAAVGDLARLRELLGEDAECTRACAGDGFTALHLGAFCGQVDAVRLLIERGADVTAVATNEMKVQPIHSAAAARSVETVRLLLEAGAEPDAQQRGGWTALHSAALHGEVEMASVLLNAGASRDVKSDDGRTAFDLATEAKQAEVLTLLNGGSLAGSG